jgi:hypothetical protein
LINRAFDVRGQDQFDETPIELRDGGPYWEFMLH